MEILLFLKTEDPDVSHVVKTDTDSMSVTISKEGVQQEGGKFTTFTPMDEIVNIVYNARPVDEEDPSEITQIVIVTDAGSEILVELSEQKVMIEYDHIYILDCDEEDNLAPNISESDVFAMYGTENYVVEELL